MEPAETLREDNQAAHTRESRQPVSQPPVSRLNKTQQSIRTQQSIYNNPDFSQILDPENWFARTLYSLFKSRV
jgi:hypothetical protein